MKTKKFTQRETYGKSSNKHPQCLKEGGVHKIFLIIRRGVYWRETFAAQVFQAGDFLSIFLKLWDYRGSFSITEITEDQTFSQKKHVQNV